DRPPDPTMLPKPQDISEQLGPAYDFRNGVNDAFTVLELADALATVAGLFKEVPAVLAPLSGLLTIAKGVWDTIEFFRDERLDIVYVSDAACTFTARVFNDLITHPPAAPPYSKAPLRW